MNYFDIAILIILGACLMAGVYRGPLKEFFSMSGLFTGAYMALKYYVTVAKWLPNWVSNDVGFNIISFLIIFCEIYTIIILLGIIAQHLIKTEPPLRAVRVFGGIMGFLKGIFIVSVILIALIAFLPKGASLIRKSIFSPYVAAVSEVVSEIIPTGMKDELKDLEKARRF